MCDVYSRQATERELQNVESTLNRTEKFKTIEMFLNRSSRFVFRAFVSLRCLRTYT